MFRIEFYGIVDEFNSVLGLVCVVLDVSFVSLDVKE